jgi:molecular chaperone GrpE
MKEKEDLKNKLEEAEKKRDEYFSGWQREKAGFINYKKQEFERLKGTLCIAKESLFSELIPILDSFNLAEKNIPEKEKEENSIKGLILIKKKLEDSLKGLGLTEMETVGKKFDPSLHEAVGEIEGKEQGIIVEEVEKGYLFENKVIRPAKVKMGK